MTKTLNLLVLSSIAILSGLVGWYVGNTSGLQRGKIEGQSTMQTQLDVNKSQLSDSNASYQELSQSYQALSDNYDKLYQAAQNYVNTPRYVPETPITCNSYGYGMNSVSTTCY